MTFGAGTMRTSGYSTSVTAIPTFVFERVAWERRFDRTVGWSFAVGRAQTSDRALFCVTSLDGALADLGTRAEAVTVAV